MDSTQTTRRSSRILYLVFVQLLRFGSATPYTGVYLLFGIVIWGFFGETTTLGLASLVARADLLRKIHFPRYVVVLSVGISALISFGLSMVVRLVFMIVARVPVTRERSVVTAPVRGIGRIVSLTYLHSERLIRALPRRELHLGGRPPSRLLRYSDHLSSEPGRRISGRRACCF